MKDESILFIFVVLLQYILGYIYFTKNEIPGWFAASPIACMLIIIFIAAFGLKNV